MTEITKFEFSGGGLTEIFGKYLVTDPVIPIFEMVKNSWDACAHNVEIEISGDHVTLKDDGIGFPGDRMKRWLTPGSLNEDDIEAPCLWRHKNRVRTGFFDAGHMVAFALGSNLSIETCDVNNVCSHIDADYEKLKNGQDGILIDTFTDRRHPQGTLIKVNNLSSNITIDEKFIKKVNRVMDTFRNSGEEFSITVRYLAEDNTEDIKYHSTKFDGPGKKLTERINFSLKVGDGRLEFKVGGTEMSSDGELLQRIKKEIERTVETFSQKISIDDLYRLLSGVKITGKVYANDLPEWEYGVFIYRDHVRVMPYGSIYGGDWLGLDTERAQRGVRRYPRNKNIFCMIDIEREGNPGLLDALDREGLIKNNSFFLLYSLTRAVLSRVSELPRGRRPTEGRGEARQQIEPEEEPEGEEGSVSTQYTPAEELKMLRWLINNMAISDRIKSRVIQAINRAVQEAVDSGHIINAYSLLTDFFNESIRIIRERANDDQSMTNAPENTVKDRFIKHYTYSNKISNYLSDDGKRDIDCLLKNLLRASKDLRNISGHVPSHDFGSESPGFSFLDRTEGFMTTVLVMASVVQLLQEGRLTGDENLQFRCGEGTSGRNRS